MMDVFVVDRQWRRDHVIDYYISFIWTERYNSKGDFELIVASTKQSRAALKVGRYVQIQESDRLMEILQILDGKDEEGRRILKVKGYSLEYLLEDRIALSPGATAAPFWWRTNRTPSSYARNLYREICYENIRDPKLHFGAIGIDETPKPGTIPEPAEAVLFEHKPRVLYDAMVDTCAGYDLGFGIFIKDKKDMHSMTEPFVFRVYTGYNRTSAQNVNDQVIFAPDLENLEHTTSMVSSVGQKNVALVISGSTMLEVYAPHVTPEISQRGRKVMLIEMDEHTDMTPAELTSLMKQRGRKALSSHRILEAFDGEIDHFNTRYLYGRDYGLGDLVELRNTDGATSHMMVTEQIFASDAEGIRWYPTLTLFEYIQS